MFPQDSIIPAVTGGLAFDGGVVNVIRLYAWLSLFLFPVALSLSHDELPLRVKIIWTTIVAVAYSVVVGAPPPLPPPRANCVAAVPVLLLSYAVPHDAEIR